MPEVRLMTVSAAGHDPPWTLRVAGDRAELLLAGDWQSGPDGPVASPEILDQLADHGAPRELSVSGAALRGWNNHLAAALYGLQQNARSRGISTEFTNLPPGLARMLAMSAAGKEAPEPEAGAETLFVAVGERALRLFGAMGEICASIGAVVLAAVAAAGGRARVRTGDYSALVRAAGAGALGIVAVVNFLVGAILAFIGAVQLELFGAQIYVADLVGIATAREMAAIITAIVLAGRTGAAYASEIAAMQGNEEIDALRTFGVSPYEYLMMPRVLALSAVMPFLYIYACAVGILGGLVIAVGMLHMTADAYVEEIRRAVGVHHFVIGGLKSLCFGALIAIVGCHIGLQAGRSAADVGRAATSAVVVSILGIILIDAVFAVCAYILGV
jgi:phospholipid/cholesterol/gamma-HCH transport system permease protein